MMTQYRRGLVTKVYMAIPLNDPTDSRAVPLLL